MVTYRSEKSRRQYTAFPCMYIPSSTRTCKSVWIETFKFLLWFRRDIACKPRFFWGGGKTRVERPYSKLKIKRTTIPTVHYSCSFFFPTLKYYKDLNKAKNEAPVDLYPSQKNPLGVAPMIKTDYLSAENFKKTRKLDGSILKPAMKPCDTGQRIPCFDGA